MMLPQRPYNVLSKTCLSRRVLELISDKWVVLVLFCLTRGTMRYSELQRMIDGISKKMLTQTLRDLERNGLISRTVYQVIPPHVEYSLTPMGASLREQMRGLCEWAEQNLEAVYEARDDYDRTQGQNEVMTKIS